MEVEASQTPYTARHGQLRSAENPSYEGPQQHHNLDSESSSPTLAPQVMLATDGSLLLMSGKEGGKPGGTHVFKVERAGDASASKSRRGMQLQERVGEKRVVSSSAMEDEDGGTGDEGRRGAGGSEGDEDEDEDEDGYASAASRDDERSRPSIESKNTHTRKSRFPKMPKAVPKVHVTRTVKVHKLNEMGEIVDKRGHRAWEMACGLQLGVRVMVSVNCQKAAEPDFGVPPVTRLASAAAASPLACQRFRACGWRPFLLVCPLPERLVCCARRLKHRCSCRRGRQDAWIEPHIACAN